jgi:PAS domain S-box-containing protein
MDVKTLFILNILIAYLMGGSMLIFMRLQKTHRGFGWWAATAIMAGAGYSLGMARIFLKGPLADFLTYIIANTFISSLLLFRLQGIRKFFGRDNISPAYLIIPALVFISYCYFFYIVPDAPMRTFSSSFFISISALILAREFIINRKSGSKTLNQIIASMNIVFALAFLSRGIYILTFQDYRFLSNNHSDMAFFTMLPLFEVAWNVFFILLNSQRTYDDLDTAMEEKIKADEAVIAANADYREIFDNANDAIFIDDIKTGSMIDVNKKMIEMYGYSREEILQINIGALSSGEPGYTQDDAIGLVKKAIEGQPQLFEWKARDKSGRIFWVEVNLKRVSLGGIDRVIAIARNIDERKCAEEERRKNDEKIQQVQKLESLGVLAGGIAHDFNNLLMIILGNIDMSMMSIPLDSAVVKNLKMAENACINAANLTRQMLAYAGKTQFIIQNVNLNEIIKDMDTAVSLAASKKAEMKYNLSDGLPCFTADPGQIKQLFMALVMNAAEAIGENEGVISVKTGVCGFDKITSGKGNIFLVENIRQVEYVFLEVSDSGCGIESDILPKIFDPFFTTKFVGRGLGLAAAMGIMKSMDSTVKVESSPGKGSAFTFYFPVIEIQEKEDKRSRPGKTALLVDDEDSVLEIGAQMLEALGYETITAKNGAEAVDIIKRRSCTGSAVSFVILDIGMPVMNGEEAYAEIMKIDGKIPVFISTGYGETDIAERFSNMKTGGMLYKPYKLEDMSKVLNGYFYNDEIKD